MNEFIINIIVGFQNMVAQVPEWIQPLIVALAGMVPFVEGEVASSIGIVGGIHPVISAIAAIAGNFLCVALVVLLTSGVRSAVTANREVRESSPKKQKFRRLFERFGVPGVSLLGPLLLPTQFTAAALVGFGVSKARVLFWQAIAIVGWTTVMTLVVTGVLHVVL